MEPISRRLEPCGSKRGTIRRQILPSIAEPEDVAIWHVEPSVTFQNLAGGGIECFGGLLWRSESVGSRKGLLRIPLRRELAGDRRGCPGLRPEVKKYGPAAIGIRPRVPFLQDRHCFLRPVTSVFADRGSEVVSDTIKKDHSCRMLVLQELLERN